MRQIGGSARGYPAGFASPTARSCPRAVSPDLYFYAAAPRDERPHLPRVGRRSYAAWAWLLKTWMVCQLT